MNELFQADFFAQEAPKVQPGEADQFVELLRGRGWRTAIQLGARRDSERRKIRAIAEASNGRILCGQYGYALTAEASQEDVSHCIARMRSQATKMNKRADEIKMASKL